MTCIFLQTISLLFIVKKHSIVYESPLKSIPLCMWAHWGLRYKWLNSVLQRKSPRLEEKTPLVTKLTKRSGHRIPPISGHPGRISTSPKKCHGNPDSCSVLWCFSPNARVGGGQPPSCIFLNKSLVWGLLCCVALWSFSVPDCQDTFPVRPVTFPVFSYTLPCCCAPSQVL